MGKSKNTQTTQAAPWVPSTSVFNSFKNRAAGTITPGFTEALGAARDGVAELSERGAYAPGFESTISGFMDPSTRSAAFDQVKQNVLSDVMPAINGQFAGAGMAGGSLHAQNLAKGVTAGMAGVENDAFQRGQDRAMSAATTLNSAYGQDFARRLGLIQATQGIGESDQAARSNALGQLLSSATGNAAQSTTSSQSPGLMQVLGTGLSVASLFSDERLKEDAKKVGEMDDGTPIHTYKYKPGAAPSPEMEGVTLMGVMAQRLKGKNKDALINDPSGYKRVNYEALA